MSGLKAAITAVASYLPEGRLTNEDLARAFPDWSAEKILEKTGIAWRAIAGPGECASDLAAAAAGRLFDQGAISPKEVDFLLFCTQSPDYFLPATACLLQQRLGLRTGCGAIDFNQGCSGFVYGLALAKGLIETGLARHVLLLTAETYTKFINPRDRSVRTIFGDGAAATLVEGIEADEDLLGPFVLGTEGAGAGDLMVPAGGSRRPASPATSAEALQRDGNWRCEQNLYMNGPAVFAFTLRTVPAMVHQLLTKAALAPADIDCFVFHQANRYMLEHLRDKLKIPPERFWIDVEGAGNTVSATIPMALEEALRRHVIRTGNRVMAVGFGVGYSWGAALIRVR